MYRFHFSRHAPAGTSNDRLRTSSESAVQFSPFLFPTYLKTLELVLKSIITLRGHRPLFSSISKAPDESDTGGTAET